MSMELGATVGTKMSHYVLGLMMGSNVWAVSRGCLRRCLALVMTAMLGAAQAGEPEHALQGVYPAEIDDGLALYAIVQSLKSPPGWDPPRPEGTLVAVLISAAPSGGTTAARRMADGGPCAPCTAQHYFLLPEQNRVGQSQKLHALRHPPSYVAYLHAKGKEYGLGSIRVRWTTEGPRLERAELTRTGFVPPLFKSKIRLRFGEPLGSGPGPEADEIEAMAHADIVEYVRPFREP